MDQFNQTVLLQAPAGVTEADVVVVLQALLDRHAMLRLRVEDDGAGGLVVTRARGRFGGCARMPADSGRVVRRGGGGARSRLNPAAGVMLSALWVASTASWW